jgi:hypothetical protein
MWVKPKDVLALQAQVEKIQASLDRALEKQLRMENIIAEILALVQKEN